MRRKEYNPEERDAKQVTLASFQDSAGWDTYICQSSRQGNASPTFAGTRRHIATRSVLWPCDPRFAIFISPPPPPDDQSARRLSSGSSRGASVGEV